MSIDIYGQKLISAHCWTIYELIISHFVVSEDFSNNFLDIVDLALNSNLFRIKIDILKEKFILMIIEEYEINQYELTVKSYSYNLIDKNLNNILRADSLPHHHYDYKNKRLTNFPHHLHDEKKRICSFSGEISDFIKHISTFINKL
jgi:hypothetical protein